MKPERQLEQKGEAVALLLTQKDLQDILDALDGAAGCAKLAETIRRLQREAVPHRLNQAMSDSENNFDLIPDHVLSKTGLQAKRRSELASVTGSVLSHHEIHFLLWCLGYAERMVPRDNERPAAMYLSQNCDGIRKKLKGMAAASAPCSAEWLRGWRQGMTDAAAIANPNSNNRGPRVWLNDVMREQRNAILIARNLKAPQSPTAEQVEKSQTGGR